MIIGLPQDEEKETPFLEYTNKILHTPRPIEKEQSPHRRLNQNYLLVFGGSPVEAWVGRDSPQRRGRWQQQSWKFPLGVSPLGGHH